MKPGGDQEPLIAEVLDWLRRSRAFLLDPSPQNIDCCRMVMAQCAERMARLGQNPEIACGDTKAFAASIRLVRDELAAISGLLASAARFRRGLLQAMRGAAEAPAPALDNTREKVRRLHVLC